MATVADGVKHIILGQDPYPSAAERHGQDVERYNSRFIIVTAEELKTKTLADVFLEEVSGTSWDPIMKQKKVKEGLLFVADRFAKKQETFIPPPVEIPTAFVVTPWGTPADGVKVVIFGQDPYPEPGMPTGLAFSLHRGRPLSASLHAIFGVYSKTLGYPKPKHGCLLKWALQGVLLLNSALTTVPYKPGEQVVTWRAFIGPLIHAMSEARPLIWVMWGKPAQELRKEIKGNGHIFLEGPHPVAHGNIFSSVNHFVEINDALKKQGKTEIDWKLDD